jgi:tetratricopeptide (TPR) repeat protein
MHDICTEHWYRLLPLNTGTFANSYINGQWSATAIGDNASIASMIGVTGEPANTPYGPLFYASSALADGRVIVNGGEAEYSTGVCTTNPATDSTKGSLYNPQTNTWVPVAPPPGWATIADAASVLLGVNNITGAYSTSNYMLQNCCDPNANQFQAGVATITGNNVAWTITSAGKADANNEEGWTLLPNGQVLTVERILGHLLCESGMHDTAITHYQEAIALAPNDALAHSHLGRFLGELGRIADARAAFEKASRCRRATLPIT